MREAGYDFTPEKVSKKWHNITITYQKNAEKDPNSVNWEFFDDMHNVFQNKDMHEENSMDYNDVEPKQNGMAKRKTADSLIVERYFFRLCTKENRSMFYNMLSFDSQQVTIAGV